MGFLIMLLVGDPQRFSIYTTTEKKLHFFEDSFTEFTIRIKSCRIQQEIEKGSMWPDLIMENNRIDFKLTLTLSMVSFGVCLH